MPGTHARLSPSGAHRWMECGGSVPLSDQFPESTSSFALEGTVAHLLFEEMAKGTGLGTNPHELIGFVSDGEQIAGAGLVERSKDLLIEIDKPMAEHVAKFIEYIEEIPGEREIEVKVFLDRWIPDSYGKVDVLVVNHEIKQITVIDLKYGRGVRVDAQENPQLRLYALGALDYLDMTGDLNIDDTAELADWCIELIVYQPRMDHIDAEVFENAADLLAWGNDEVKPVADKASAMTLQKLELNPGEKQCRFCPAKGKCSALAEQSLKAAGVNELEVEKPLISDADLDAIYPLLPNIASWMKAVSETVQERLHDGAHFESAKLVRANTHRKWADEAAAYAYLLSKKTINKADIINEKLVSPTQALKVISKNFKRPNAVIQELNEDFIIKPEGAVVVAPITDKRAAYTPTSAADEFETIKPEDFVS